ncbi:hypothetical protein JCM3775_006711 [Rhodotorula graminis]|uniref:COP9 signalosome complex subunit 6 n=1 Tax=Rhodotorula graminis (strain WP1) TaxID=578459 RepID=A0A194S9H4_RHOGW|nr:uncharacterized protein RHOBADRAFT_52067 [Rhodotorula graminis WP1]KPV77115.1 hypothetical protein RHOBADRAFT_52067 [Rhodotorula graminis WP1]
MASSEGLKVALHPLAILQQSDHWTRVSLQSRGTATRVTGALLGTQSGRDVEIFNSFELVVNTDPDSGKLQLDHAYFDTRRDQFKQVFPTLDFLGWYSVGHAPSPDDTALHKQFFVYNESPLFLQFSPPSSSTSSSSSPASKDLPVAIYESVIELVDDAPEPVFVPCAYEIVTGEAERVAVEGVSRPEEGTEGGAGGSLILTLTTQRAALAMLADRIAVVVRYLEAVTRGEARADNETMRGIAALLGSLLASGEGEGERAGEGAGAGAGEGEGRRGEGEVRKEGLRGEFMTEYNDVLLTTYLATLTKQLQTANNLLDKQLLVVQSSSNTNTTGGDPRAGGGGKDGGGNSRDPFGFGFGGAGGGGRSARRSGRHVESFA